MYGFMENTILMAIKIFDKFVAVADNVQTEMHPLLGMTSLCTAVKMQE